MINSCLISLPNYFNRERIVFSLRSTDTAVYSQAIGVVGPILLPYNKMNSKQITDVNVRAKILDFEEKKT